MEIMNSRLELGMVRTDKMSSAEKTASRHLDFLRMQRSHHSSRQTPIQFRNLAVVVSERVGAGFGRHINCPGSHVQSLHGGQAAAGRK